MGLRNPLEMSEFEVQAEAFNRLRETFKNVRGEFCFRAPEPGRSARFDLAILDSENRLRVVVEVKRSARRKVAKQVARYKALTGCPIVTIHGFDQAQNAVKRVIDVIGIPVPKHGDIYVGS